MHAYVTAGEASAHRRLGVLLVLAGEVERDVVDDHAAAITPRRLASPPGWRHGILHSHARRLEERPRLWHVGTAEPGRHEAEGGACHRVS